MYFTWNSCDLQETQLDAVIMLKVLICSLVHSFSPAIWASLGEYASLGAGLGKLSVKGFSTSFLLPASSPSTSLSPPLVFFNNSVKMEKPFLAHWPRFDSPCMSCRAHSILRGAVSKHKSLADGFFEGEGGEASCHAEDPPSAMRRWALCWAPPPTLIALVAPGKLILLLSGK